MLISGTRPTVPYMSGNSSTDGRARAVLSSVGRIRSSSDTKEAEGSFGLVGSQAESREGWIVAELSI